MSDLWSGKRHHKFCKDCGSGIYSPPASKGPLEIGSETPKPKKTILTSRPRPSDCSSTTTTQKGIPLKTSSRKLQMDLKKTSDWKTEIDVPQPNLKVSCEDVFRITNSSLSGSVDNGSCSDLNQEAKHVLFNKSCDEKSKKIGGLRSRSRVVPFIENENCELNVAVNSASEDIYWNHKEVEDLFLIQKQLVQIENQQSSLLDLLQRFIGSSQSGMNSLETRVNGLEMVLDEISQNLVASNGSEISQNLAVSSGSVSDTDSAGNTCCMLSRAEFLSPKFWRRTEGQYSTSRVSSPERNHSLAAMSNIRVKDANSEMFKLDYPKS